MPGDRQGMSAADLAELLLPLPSGSSRPRLSEQRGSAKVRLRFVRASGRAPAEFVCTLPAPGGRVSLATGAASSSSDGDEDAPRAHGSAQPRDAESTRVHGGAGAEGSAAADSNPGPAGPPRARRGAKGGRAREALLRLAEESLAAASQRAGSYEPPWARSLTPPGFARPLAADRAEAAALLEEVAGEAHAARGRARRLDGAMAAVLGVLVVALVAAVVAQARSQGAWVARERARCDAAASAAAMLERDRGGRWEEFERGERARAARELEAALARAAAEHAAALEDERRGWAAALAAAHAECEQAGRGGGRGAGGGKGGGSAGRGEL
jgi:hypothetical protein